jgi:hypothetical protein
MEGKTVRHTFAYIFLGLYTIYGLFGLGMTGLLFSFAIGLIATSFDQSIEIVVAITILSGLAFNVFTKNFFKEGFQGNSGVETGTGENLTAISKRVQELSKRKVFEPSGVLSSDFAESFADMNTAEQPENAGSNTAKPAGEATPSPSTSTPAAINQPTVSQQLEKALPSSNAAAAATPNPKSTEKPTPTQQPQPTVTSGFSDKGTDGMFKLGSIPTEAIGGSHIDIGTTLMNTLNSLKPDQVKAMTEDTRKLMETQKNLMGMLTTMKPMIQDGKQLMETFGQMFGSSQ